jgi:hypothetical protein
LSGIRRRAKEHFPSVLLTFLSIVQALALELWWSSMLENESLWAGGWDAWVGWAQYTTALLGILEIWLVYTGMVMRFIWLPGFNDTVFPFLVGIIEFSMVAVIGPEHLAAWMTILAVMFIIMVGSTHITFVQARQEPENDGHFRNVEPASRRDFSIQFLMIGGILAMALLLRITGNTEALAFWCIVLCAGILLHQIDVSRRFWNRSMEIVDD